MNYQIYMTKKNCNKVDGVFKEIDSDEKGEDIYDKNWNFLGDN